VLYADSMAAERNQIYESALAKTFFDYFVNATTAVAKVQSDSNLSPLESYFTSPGTPFKASEGPTLHTSRRHRDPSPRSATSCFHVPHLLNAYWLASMQPFSVVSGIDVEDLSNGVVKPLPVAEGSMYVERIVLRCHKTYFAVLLVISLGLCAIGMTTVDLEAIRRGPDVLNEFINSLRHSPYVHVDGMGPSMQDGREISRRLRNTVVQMGDVRPDDHVGYVAIATPNLWKPVERLDPRHYL
jgi:hypothetical protein